MNHNPHNLKEGQIVILDKDFNNAIEVGIDSFTPSEMFAIVYNKNEVPLVKYPIMTYRLSPK